jgi:3-hydroxyacyl-CoA dehydrogenase/enoyl-CoA hydratase/3-hydroxybutyryl-CoA epimerase
MNAILTPPQPEMRRPAVAPPPSFRLEPMEDGLLAVVFDRPGSSANIFDSAALLELESVLDDLGQRRDVRGIVFRSAKPSIFIAGADLKELAAARSPADLVELGQRVFEKIARLGCVTVAAIHGACAGGGVELSLACDYRIASDDPATRIGLPEVQLGIIPAWGGSTRLPRLIGLPGALRVILDGNLFPAAKARRLGIVDALAPRERLAALAARYVKKGKRRNLCHLRWLAAAPIIAFFARRAADRKTRGHYPAARRAIEVVTHSVSSRVAASLAREKAAILELAQTDACRNLIRVFFLQERARKMPAPLAKKVAATAVIGAGVMGAGIAQWTSARGLRVILRDVGAEPLARGLQNAAGLYATAVKRRIMTVAEAQAGMDRIFPAEVPVPLRSTDLVIEAAVEKMDLKQRIFAQLEEQTRPDTILATNTSALSITRIAAGLRHPERVVGLHFFNPVHRMKLVEVVRGEQSAPEALDTAVAFAQRIGKLPVVVRDRPGFLVNRILMPYLLEAALLFEAGASARDLDEAMLDFGMPMGPMRLLDEVGLDVATDVARTLCEAFAGRMRMPEFLPRMLDAGAKGRKSGAGFYVYAGSKKVEENPAAKQFQQRAVAVQRPREELQRRMALLMVNEAARCLEERVVETPQDVDFGMVMGTGFAPFRGGPLRHANAVGIGAIVDALQRLSDAGDARFEPCDLLKEKRNGHFYANDCQ